MGRVMRFDLWHDISGIACVRLSACFSLRVIFVGENNFASGGSELRVGRPSGRVGVVVFCEAYVGARYLLSKSSRANRDLHSEDAIMWRFDWSIKRSAQCD